MIIGVTCWVQHMMIGKDSMSKDKRIILSLNKIPSKKARKRYLKRMQSQEKKLPTNYYFIPLIHYCRSKSTTCQHSTKIIKSHFSTSTSSTSTPYKLDSTVTYSYLVGSLNGLRLLNMVIKYSKKTEIEKNLF